MSGPIRNLIARVRANRPQRQQRRAERRERRRETLRSIINPMESIGNADAAASKPRRFELFVVSALAQPTPSTVGQTSTGRSRSSASSRRTQTGLTLETLLASGPTTVTALALLWTARR